MMRLGITTHPSVEQRKADGMGDGEGGDDFYDGGNSFAANQQGEEEQQMIVAGENMFDAHAQKLREWM